MTLYVVRHGQTDWNIEERLQGSRDIPLNSNGIKQAQNVSEKLKLINLDIIISSPLKRALQTANIINKNHNLSISIDERLKERDFGDLEGLNDISLYNCNIHTLTNYKENYHEYHVEPIQDLFKRVNAFINMCQQEYKDKNILIVTHAGVAQVLDVLLNHLPFDTNLLQISLKNCEYRKYII